ncbi:MAG: DNA-binding protein [Actinomycetes bacterium]
MSTNPEPLLAGRHSPGTRLNRDDAALYLMVPVSTLAHWAVYGGGPRFFKVGRRCQYLVADLDDFLDANLILPGN